MVTGKKRLLLVGWDSADWKLIHPLLDQGKLPGVARLVEGGISGNLTTLEPQLSPMLWTSIATGKMAYHHGVHGFTEVDPVSGNVVPVSAATRRCKTLWEILGERGLRSHVVGWFATQGEQDLRGKMVSNMYGHLRGITRDQEPAQWPAAFPGTYWPEDLGRELDELRVSPFEITGEDVLRAFVPDAPRIDQSKDRRLQELAKRLAEAYSVQSAATYLMETDPEWDFMAVYFRALDEISHTFMPYHPPRMDGVPEDAFQMYREVVTGAYRAHDMMLQRLIHLAGPETAVVLVSDHGFHCDHLRPVYTPRVPAGITVWHRAQGVIAAHGPGFKKDELIHGARLLDIAPTVLHYFGLPVGEDMEGRVLREAFAEEREVEFTATWESSGAPRPQRGLLAAEDSRALLDQFVSLGYIDEIPADPTAAARATIRENQWNLARAFLYSGKHEQALPLLEDCLATHPERTDYGQLLARTQLHLGLADEAAETLESCLGRLGETLPARLLMGSIESQRGNPAAALEHLLHVRDTAPEEPQLLHHLSEAFLTLRRWEEAADTAERMLRVDPGSAQGHFVRARCFLHRAMASEAAESALDGIGLQYGNPRGHFLLGLALAQMEDFPASEKALLNTLRLDPMHRLAMRYLATVHQAQGKRAEAADCEQRSRVLRATARSMHEARLARLRQESGSRGRERLARSAVTATDESAARAEVPEREMEFVIVSGLPRSGTSLMMQILCAGGMELMHDGRREADDDNPEGYWEWEDIKSLKRNPRVIEQAEGKAIKIISALLPNLPPRHRYKIVFMRRPVAEVIDSQWKMLRGKGVQPQAEKEHLAATQETHVRQMLAAIRSSGRAELIEVDYPALVADPVAGVAMLRGFLGGLLPGDPDAMAAMVKPALHRNRAM